MKHLFRILKSLINKCAQINVQNLINLLQKSTVYLTKKLHKNQHFIYFVTGDASKVISLGPALRFNGGGHLNHAIFWQTLSPHGNAEPEGKLLEAIQVCCYGYVECIVQMLLIKCWCWYLHLKLSINSGMSQQTCLYNFTVSSEKSLRGYYFELLDLHAVF